MASIKTSESQRKQAEAPETEQASLAEAEASSAGSASSPSSASSSSAPSSAPDDAATPAAALESEAATAADTSASPPRAGGWLKLKLFGTLLVVVVAWLTKVYLPVFLKSHAVELEPSLTSPDSMMSALYYAEHGDTSVIQYGSIPAPVPNADQLLVTVSHSALNPCDFKFRRLRALSLLTDWLLPKPHILAEDFAGVVTAKAADGSHASRRLQVGDRVCGMLPLLGSRWGSSADRVAARASTLARIPDNVSDADAASLPLVALTVVQAMEAVKFPLEGKKVLIQAGSGGVGSFGIQYCKHVLGMYVAATTSGKNAAFVKSLGADLVIDYEKENFEDVVKDYDVVLDSLSFMHEYRTLNSGVLHNGGHYLNILSSDWALGAGGKEMSNGPLSLIRLLGCKALHYLNKTPKSPDYDIITVVPNGEQLQRVLDWVSEGKIKAQIDSTFPIKDGKKAFERLETGRAVGKVVLSVK